MQSKSEAIVKEKYELLNSRMDEKVRRLWAAAESLAIGHGGQTIVERATGIARRTIYAGLQELLKENDNSPKIRTSGGGRKKIEKYYPEIKKELENIVDPTTRGDPESPLKWTCLSVRQLEIIMQKKGFKIGRQKIYELLEELGYSLQSNRKTKEGNSHPDRNGQFEFINTQVQKHQKENQPVISVDTKKKELVGTYKNNGKEWRPKGTPEEVNVYDFIDKKLGKVNPYGVYDQTNNVGWVSVGTDHDTAEFAVESIRKWWVKMGKLSYPKAKKLLITADGGGSNSSRNRLWKVSLQKLANGIGLEISVCHFPPGTSKWNKIEHRMFSHISMNWRGKPLISHDVVVNLIANTTTRKGLRIKAELDSKTYPTGIKISDEEFNKVNLKRAIFHGEWNYSIQKKIQPI